MTDAAQGRGLEDFGSAALRRLLDAFPGDVLATLPGAVLETHARVGDATAVASPSRACVSRTAPGNVASSRRSAGEP